METIKNINYAELDNKEQIIEFYIEKYNNGYIIKKDGNSMGLYFKTAFLARAHIKKTYAISAKYFAQKHPLYFKIIP